LNTIACKYFDFHNWKDTQTSLINYFKKLQITELWYPISLEEMEENVPEVVATLRKNNIIPLQLIFFQFPGPTDLNINDPNDIRTPYLHIDNLDNEEVCSKTRTVTLFSPVYVLNIPLINCEKSETLFYNYINPEEPELQWHAWGPKNNEIRLIDRNNVVLFDRITLDKPAFLKINMPHAVHNPTNEPRIVASIRIGNDNIP
jgi:hypothetical protein